MNNQKSKVSTSKAIIEQVTVDKLDKIIADANFTIIDVRSPKGIEKQGSIPKAVNIPFDSIEKAVEAHRWDPDSIFKSNGPLLFCCTGGVMSYMAAIKAKERGISNVFNLEGGHSAWLKYKAGEAIS